MRVLFYIDTIGYGGAERVIANLANQFITLGCESIVVTTFRKEKEYILDSGVIRFSMDDEYNAPFWKRNFKLIRRLRTIIKQHKPDVAIAFLPESIFRIAISSIALGLKKIYSVRSDPRFVYRTISYKILASIILPGGDGFVFQTKDAQDYYPRIIRKKSTIIYNQVAEEFYKVGFNGKRSGIIATGRLVPPKEYFFLVDAFELIKDKTEDNLTIYGDGPLREKITEYVREKGLEQRVFLPGSTSNVPETISSAKVFVLSSNHEGMPNGLMEAMAAGVPCVSTDCPCGGPRTLFGEKQKSFLVPVNDKQKLAKALLKVVESEDLRKELSTENKTRALMFRPEVIKNEWFTFINKVVNG